MKLRLFAGLRRAARASAVRIGPVQICTPFLLCTVWFFLLLWDSSGFLALGLAASLWHELGHLLCYTLLYRRFPPVKITLWGIGLELGGEPLSAGSVLLHAAAGPGMNLAGAGVCLLLMRRRLTVRLAALFSANVLVGGFNLLPLPPLDGFRIAAALAALVREKLHFGPE